MSLSLSGTTNVQEVKYKRTQTTNLLEYAEENRHCGMFNDITITIGDDTFPANRMVLSCYSHFFETMFKTEMKEKYQDSVEIENVDGNSMKNLILFIYTGNININSENVCNLLSASDYLQIEDVKKFCFEFLASAITSENCFIILALADRYRNDELTNQIKKFMADNFEKVLCSGGFQKLTKKEMTTCISKLDRDTVMETTIYKAIIEWTNHDLDGRECDFPEHFKLIDLHKVPSHFLRETVSNEKLVINNFTCSKMLIPVLAERLKLDNTESEQSASSINRSSSSGDQKTSILCFGGVGTDSKVIEVYNISNETKKKYPDLPVGRYSACSIAMGATVLNDTIVVMGGYDRGKNLSTGECFNPITKSWHNVSSMIYARRRHALVACKGSIYALGGCNGVFKSNTLSSVERCHPPFTTWKEIKSLQTPRSELVAVNCDDVIYAIGGDSGNGTLKSSEKYDFDNNRWTYISDMKFARHGLSACVMQGKIYVVGGRDRNNKYVRAIECYDPSTNEWSIVGEVDVDLYLHSIVAV